MMFDAKLFRDNNLRTILDVTTTHRPSGMPPLECLALLYHDLNLRAIVKDDDDITTGIAARPRPVMCTVKACPADASGANSVLDGLMQPLGKGRQDSEKRRLAVFLAPSNCVRIGIAPLYHLSKATPRARAIKCKGWIIRPKQDLMGCGIGSVSISLESPLENTCFLEGKPNTSVILNALLARVAALIAATRMRWAITRTESFSKISVAKHLRDPGKLALIVESSRSSGSPLFGGSMRKVDVRSGIYTPGASLFAGMTNKYAETH
ncbi:hypothetical protein EDD85DRAFT_786583 [Armillaria nabsnona]|nr:hypothetical protein EDD85DRAFT_786583 [Armillaria nabsnona]